MYATHTTNTTHTEEINIEELEKEIKIKKKLLKQKKEEERKKEEELKEIERKKEEENLLKQEIPMPSASQNIELKENDYIDLRICPLCNNKLKRKKVRQENFVLTQILKCKKCGYKKEITLKI